LEQVLNQIWGTVKPPVRRWIFRIGNGLRAKRGENAGRFHLQIFDFRAEFADFTIWLDKGRLRQVFSVSGYLVNGFSYFSKSINEISGHSEILKKLKTGAS
jgi:hypothetical protein